MGVWQPRNYDQGEPPRKGVDPYSRQDKATGRFRNDYEDTPRLRQDVHPVARVGETRAFVHLWDIDAAGVIKTPMMSAGWSRGELRRQGQPIFVLTSLGPMYDPTNPHGWRYGTPASTRAEL